MVGVVCAHIWAGGWWVVVVGCGWFQVRISGELFLMGWDMGRWGWCVVLNGPSR